MIKKDHTKARTQTVTTLRVASGNLPAPTMRTEVSETQAERFIRLLSEALASDQLRLSRDVGPGFGQRAETFNKRPHANARFKRMRVHPLDCVQLMEYADNSDWR